MKPHIACVLTVPRTTLDPLCGTRPVANYARVRPKVSRCDDTGITRCLPLIGPPLAAVERHPVIVAYPYPP